MWDHKSNSHQMSQSTYSLLFFRGQMGYESKTVVECTQKNKIGNKGGCAACRSSFSNGAWICWGMWQLLGAGVIAVQWRWFSVGMAMGNLDGTWSHLRFHSNSCVMRVKKGQSDNIKVSQRGNTRKLKKLMIAGDANWGKKRAMLC